MSVSVKCRYFVFFLLALAVSAHADTQVADAPGGHKLAGFERLVGGRWHLGNGFLAFEWGPGRNSVRAKGYASAGGAEKIVSEGHWFWHPGERQIRGYITAIDMPVELFDFTTRFEGDRAVSDLVAFDANGTRAEYVETWEFLDAERYEWILWSKTPDGPKEIMRGTYTRQAQNREER